MYSVVCLCVSLLSLHSRNTVAQEATSTSKLTARVVRGNLVIRIDGARFESRDVELESDDPVDPFEKLTIEIDRITVPLPEYRGDQLLPVPIHVRVSYQRAPLGVVTFDYPPKLYAFQAVGFAAGVTHKGEEFGGYALWGLPFHRAGLQSLPASRDSRGKSLSLASKIAANTAFAFGPAGISGLAGPGLAYGFAFRIPFTGSTPALRNLRAFVGYRVRPGEYGRVLWGVVGFPAAISFGGSNKGGT